MDGDKDLLVQKGGRVCFLCDPTRYDCREISSCQKECFYTNSFEGATKEAKLAYGQYIRYLRILAFTILDIVKKNR